MNTSPNLNQAIARGAAWAIVMRFTIRALGFVSTVVLARLLTPDDYGVIALAMVFIGLIEAITWFGFDVVLIQDQQAPLEKYHTVWTMTVLRGLLLGAVLWTFAPLCSSVFEEPRLTALLNLLALGTVIEGFSSAGVVDFRKNMEFDRDFRLMVAPRVGGFLITIVLAFLWRDYWAMAAGMVATRVLTVSIGYLMHPYRPRFTLAHWRDVFGFSKWLLASNILGYGYRRSDSVIVGKLAGSAALGAYTVAYEISNMVLTELVAPIQRAILPGYAKLAGAGNGLRDAYLTVLGVTMAVALPMTAGIALTAEYFVPLLLGPKWLETIPLIQVLCVCGLLHVGVANSGAVYIASGRPWLTTTLYGTSLVFGLPFVLVGALRYGALGAAYGMAAMALVFVLVNGFMITRLLRLSAFEIVRICYRTAGGVTGMVALVSLLKLRLPAADGWSETALHLLLVVAIGSVAHTLLVVLLWLAGGRPQGPEQRILAFVRARF